MRSQRSRADALDVMGDANRRAIVELLARGPSSVQALADQLPISRPAVSRHLRLLKQANLVDEEAEGTRRVYRLQPASVDELRRYFEQLWAEAAGRFCMAVENTDGDHTKARPRR